MGIRSSAVMETSILVHTTVQCKACVHGLFIKDRVSLPKEVNSNKIKAHQYILQSISGSVATLAGPGLTRWLWFIKALPSYMYQWWWEGKQLVYSGTCLQTPLVVWLTINSYDVCLVWMQGIKHPYGLSPLLCCSMRWNNSKTATPLNSRHPWYNR